MEGIRHQMHLLCNSSREEEGLEAYENWLELTNYAKPETEQLEFILNCNVITDRVKHELIESVSRQLNEIRHDILNLQMAGALESKHFSENIQNDTEEFLDLNKNSFRSILFISIAIFIVASVLSILFQTMLIVNLRSFFIFLLLAIFIECVTTTLKIARSTEFDRCKAEAMDSAYVRIGLSVQSRMEWLEEYEEGLLKLNAVITKWSAKNNNINQTSD